jgi:hypothetical protein
VVEPHLIVRIHVPEGEYVDPFFPVDRYPNQQISVICRKNRVTRNLIGQSRRCWQYAAQHQDGYRDEMSGVWAKRHFIDPGFS